MLYQTHARIHLANIRFNIDGIRQAVGPERKILIETYFFIGDIDIKRL